MISSNIGISVVMYSKAEATLETTKAQSGKQLLINKKKKAKF